MEQSNPPIVPNSEADASRRRRSEPCKMACSPLIKPLNIKTEASRMKSQMRSVVPNDQRLSNGASAMVVTAPNMLANHDHFLTMAMTLPSVAGFPEHVDGCIVKAEKSHADGANPDCHQFVEHDGTQVAHNLNASKQFDGLEDRCGYVVSCTQRMSNL